MNQLTDINVTDIINIFTVFSPKGRFDKMVNRQSYGLSFCAEGQITYTLGGKKYISDPGHAIILPKGQTYTLHGNKTGIFPVINFDCTNFHSDSMVLLPVRNIESLMKDFTQLKSLFLFEKNRLKTISIFYNILHKLSDTASPESDILYPAVKYLETDFSSCGITNKSLADMCNISEVYFRKLFVRSYGVSPKQYVIDVRIGKAKQLLTDGILNITAISEQCGFSTPYHFSRLFKEKNGLTPSEYMKQNRIVKI